MAQFPKKITDDPYGAAVLIRRLVMEQGIVYWRRYLTAFALMGVAAAATAGSAYILGQVINQAYVDKNVVGIAIFSGITVVLLFIKGIATYGHTVILSKIGNAILANNQRRLFAKLMNENMAFYSQRHSSEFLARLTAGAGSTPRATKGSAAARKSAAEIFGSDRPNERLQNGISFMISSVSLKFTIMAMHFAMGEETRT